ncbi:hypothetical protein L0F63_004900, partial [Massospora cicadina]
PSVAPIHRAPIVYGFNVEDIGVALFYSTSITDLVYIKPKAPYTPKLESSIYLNPQAKTFSPKTRLEGGS